MALILAYLIQTVLSGTCLLEVYNVMIFVILVDLLQSFVESYWVLKRLSGLLCYPADDPDRTGSGLYLFTVSGGHTFQE